MLPKVTLAVNRGFMDGEEYTFGEPTVCVVGRAEDCYPRIVGDGLVSRHHCRLEINPPQVWVRDLGSSNGTYVNGRKLRGDDVLAATLKDGDEIELGLMALRVRVDQCDPDDLTAEGDRADCPEDQLSIGLA